MSEGQLTNNKKNDSEWDANPRYQKAIRANGRFKNLTHRIWQCRDFAECVGDCLQSCGGQC